MKFGIIRSIIAGVNLYKRIELRGANGVKSAGSENRTADFPLKSESCILPCVVTASKSGCGSGECGTIQEDFTVT